MMASRSATTATASTIQPEAQHNKQDSSIKEEEEESITSIIRIDGSMGEGGGQLLRNAISFATLLNQPMIVNKIRAGRSKPGLKAQHVASLQLPVQICCYDAVDDSVDDDHQQKELDLMNDDDDAHTKRHQPPQQQEHRQQQQQSHFKRQKDNDNGNISSSSSNNNNGKSAQSTTDRLGASPFLTGDSLHSQEIHFQPPPPPTRPSTISTLLEQCNNNNQNNHNHEHEQQEWTITKDIGTAGSICLLLQAALPCAIFTCLQSRKTLHLHLHGGTNATLAPQYDYWERVFLPTLQEQCGFNNTLLPSIHARMIRRGYFPRGGGHVCITIQPPAAVAAAAAVPSSVGAATTTTATTTAASSCSNNVDSTPCLHPIQLTERGDVKHIYIRSFHAGRLPRHLAETMASAAEKLLRKTFPSSSSLSSHHGRGPGHAQQQQPKHHQSHQSQQQQVPTVDIVLDIVTEPDAVGSGLGILVVATTTTGCRLAGSALSDPKKKAADVGRAAAQELLDTLQDGGCVDEWLQDQLILYMALAKGVSEIKTGSLTLHTRTAIEIAKVFCGAKCFEIHKLGSDDDDAACRSNDCRSDDDSKKKQATNERLFNGKNEIGGYNDDGYGLNGRITGQHLIRCHGIGHTVSPLDYGSND